MNLRSSESQTVTIRWGLAQHSCHAADATFTQVSKRVAIQHVTIISIFC